MKISFLFISVSVVGIVKVYKVPEMYLIFRYEEEYHIKGIMLLM